LQLVTVEIVHEGLVPFLGRNCQDTPHLLDGRGHPILDEVCERPDGGEPSISRSRRVPPASLKVFQESKDQRGLQLLKDES
jgi:hypothetical protein